jgi:hypothetical protein
MLAWSLLQLMSITSSLTKVIRLYFGTQVIGNRFVSHAIVKKLHVKTAASVDRGRGYQSLQLIN